MTKKSKQIIAPKYYASEQERAVYARLCQMLKECPIPASEILANLTLFLNRASLSRILFMHNLYRKIINVPGIVVEFGVRWGHNIVLFTILRSIYEPYNYSRQVLGFDTFEGFPNVSPEDGRSESASVGCLSVTNGYEKYLEELLTQQEKLAPRSHIRKSQLIKGDVLETFPKYLNDHPETVIALAYFDLTLYEPTKKCIDLIKGHITKGSVIGFDQLGLGECPGETLAIKERLGLTSYEVNRDPSVPYSSFLIIK